MKFFSDVTNEKYDSIAELEKAESEFNALKAKADEEKLEKQKKIEDANKAMSDAFDLYKRACEVRDKADRACDEAYSKYLDAVKNRNKVADMNKIDDTTTDDGYIYDLFNLLFL